MADKSLEDLYSQVQSEVAPKAPEDLQSLYDEVRIRNAMRNEEQFDLSTTQAPPTSDEAVATRQAGRKDMMAQYMHDLGASGPAPSVGVAATRALSVPVDFLGAAGQTIEGAEAGAINKMFGMGLEKSLPSYLPASRGIEFGDIAAKLGMPELMASLAGLVAASAADPFAAGSQAMQLSSKAANTIRSAITSNLAKNVIPKTASSLIKKSKEAIFYIIGRGGKNLTTNNMEKFLDIGQDTANQISRDVLSVKRQADRLYKSIDADAQNIPVYQGQAQKLSMDIEDMLSRVDDPDSIRKLPVGMASKIKAPVTKVSTVEQYRPGQPPLELPLGEGQTLSIPGTKPTQYVTDTASEVGANYKKAEAVKTKKTDVGHKLVSVKTTKELSDKAPAGPTTQTLGELLDTMKQGKPITSDQLSRMRTALSNHATNYKPAGAMADRVFDDLAQVDPRYIPARQSWADYSTLERQSEQAFGGFKTDYNKSLTRAERIQAVEGAGNRLSSYFDMDTAGNAPSKTALETIDRILSKYTNAPRKYLDTVMDISSASGMNQWKPSLFPVTMAGTAGWAASNAGVPKEVGWLFPVLTAGLGSPKVNSALLRTLSKSPVVPSKTIQYVTSPAGNFLLNQLRASMTSGAVGYGAVRQITGRNQKDVSSDMGSDLQLEETPQMQ